MVGCFELPRCARPTCRRVIRPPEAAQCEFGWPTLSPVNRFSGLANEPRSRRMACAYRLSPSIGFQLVRFDVGVLSWVDPMGTDNHLRDFGPGP